MVVLACVGNGLRALGRPLRGVAWNHDQSRMYVLGACNEFMDRFPQIPPTSEWDIVFGRERDGPAR